MTTIFYYTFGKVTIFRLVSENQYLGLVKISDANQ